MAHRRRTHLVINDHHPSATDESVHEASLKIDQIMASRHPGQYRHSTHDPLASSLRLDSEFKTTHDLSHGSHRRFDFD